LRVAWPPAGAVGVARCFSRKVAMKKDKPPKKRLKLEDLIYQVKTELLEATRAHAGEDALFELSGVEMEVKIATTVSGKGGVNVWVVSGESTATREATHTVTLSFKVAKPVAQRPTTEPKPKAPKDAKVGESATFLEVARFTMTADGRLHQLPQKVEPNKPYFKPYCCGIEIGDLGVAEQLALLKALSTINVKKLLKDAGTTDRDLDSPG
jgi:hypothetical protein